MANSANFPNVHRKETTSSTTLYQGSTSRNMQTQPAPMHVQPTPAMKICVVGAGPCGMSFLYQLDKMTNGETPQVVCYEKQNTWGGLWNFDWRTGTDQFGEPCHAGMYRDLWTNSPKECLELPDYTFEDHFGKQKMPSYPPRLMLREYLEGRWQKRCKKDLRRFVKFNTVVRNVVYHRETDDFTVTSYKLLEDVTIHERFTHVIVAVGIFNVPNKPMFPGMEEFRGRVIHSHDFRDAREFTGQRILVVGASYSAEDIALQCLKYGAKHVVCTWRTNPMGYKWPKGIEERPLVQRVDRNKAYFKDGSSAEFDSIIMCTGYQYKFPFMEDSLRLRSERSYYPDHLYKGTLWMQGGNNKVFYMGMQDQFFTYTMFDVQGLWTARYLLGTLQGEPRSRVEMERDVEKWVKKLRSLRTHDQEIDFQAEFVEDLAVATGYNKAARRASDMFHTWKQHKAANIATYRDQQFTSLYTGVKGATNTPWMETFHDTPMKM